MIDVIRSEWTKIRSVRSTVWTLAVTAILMVGFSILLHVVNEASGRGPITGDEAVSMSVSGTMFASLSMATLGVLVISGEYRTGGIRTSLTAVPRRMRLLTAKILAFAGVALVVSLVASVVAVGAGLLVSQPPSVDMGEVVRAVTGAGLYLMACGLFGLGLGTVIRHTPGAIVTVIALMQFLPTLSGQLPPEWGPVVASYFTTNAGALIVSGQSNEYLGPLSGFGVYLVWVAVTVAAGAVLLQRRDA
ncbi:ABC transporter permease subunit [Nonomuraea longicatena]|uniref:ABC transporter permease subunit n=1 Tax=Nonomuraea longicatena TaxID=83682 RepID=A0ABN1QCV8_9ACTN